jgi:hypothetical protein
MDEAPASSRTAELDALASMVGRVAWARGEQAAIERARAVRSGDEARRVAEVTAAEARLEAAAAAHQEMSRPPAASAGADALGKTG